MSSERLLVLACSKKLGARCVAGISLDTGEWLRPVSSPSGGALSIYHAGVDGRFPYLREVVTLEIDRRCPLVGQPENVLVTDRPWELEGRLSRSDAATVVDAHLAPGPTILGGLGRTASEAEVADSPRAPSLTVVEPESLSFEHERVPWGTGSRLWARFRLSGQSYGLTLSDFFVAPRLRALSPGAYQLGDLGIEPPPRTVLTISLAEPFQGEHYKLAAGVLGIE